MTALSENKQLQKSQRLLEDIMGSIRTSASSIVDTMCADVVHNTKVLRTVATMMEDGLILLDKDSKITIVNPSAGSIFGVDPAEAMGKTFDQLFPSLARRLEKNDAVQDLPLISDQGETSSVSLRAAFMASGEGGLDSFSPFGVLVARKTQHTTGDKELERQLSEALDLYSMTLWNFPMVVFATDMQGNNIRGSKDFFLTLGIKASNVNGRNIEEILPSYCLKWYFREEDRSSIQIPLETERGEEEFVAHKSIVRASDGTHRPLGFITCLTRHTSPNTDVSFASAFIKTLDAMDTPMMLLSSRDARILLVNRAFCDKYHYDRATLLNRGAGVLLTGDMQHRTRRKFAAELATGGEPVGTFRILDAAGRSIELRVKAIAITPEGSQTRMPKYCLLSEC